MNILMMTNTYKPLLGGLEKSIEVYSKELRALGHRVIIVAPEFPDMKPETDVVRIPAVQNFNGSDFSVQLPLPGILTEKLGDFHPDIIHSHHPFLVGDTALRAASKYNVPLVFTNHTLYEENVHYVPGDQEALKRFVMELATGYANLTDCTIAPSQSVKDLLKERGVTVPIEIIPTGVYEQYFAEGNGSSFRKKMNIPSDAFVIGHVGRLAPEKNLGFVVRAALLYLKNNPKAWLLIGGKGPSEEEIHALIEKEGLGNRVCMAGVLKDQDLVDAYHAMDAFIFASQSETQGLVITEAMAAGLPVLAVDAPGVREVVQDGLNGRLLPHESLEDFVSAIDWLAKQGPSRIKQIQRQSLATAQQFSMQHCINSMVQTYTSLAIDGFVRRSVESESKWSAAMRLINAQWEIVKNLTRATGAMFETTVES